MIPVGQQDTKVQSCKNNVDLMHLKDWVHNNEHIEAEVEPRGVQIRKCIKEPRNSPHYKK